MCNANPSLREGSSHIIISRHAQHGKLSACSVPPVIASFRDSNIHLFMVLYMLQQLGLGLVGMLQER